MTMTREELIAVFVAALDAAQIAVETAEQTLKDNQKPDGDVFYVYRMEVSRARGHRGQTRHLAAKLGIAYDLERAFDARREEVPS